MATPTFDSMALTSSAAAERVASPQVRTYAQTMPGADGEYVQPYGASGQWIYVEGVLSATGATAAVAHAAFKVALRLRQALCGCGVAEYVGTDGHSYDNCSLHSYGPVGRSQTAPSGTQFKTSARIRAVIRNHTP